MKSVMLMSASVLTLLATSAPLKGAPRIICPNHQSHCLEQRIVDELKTLAPLPDSWTIVLVCTDNWESVISEYHAKQGIEALANIAAERIYLLWPNSHLRANLAHEIAHIKLGLRDEKSTEKAASKIMAHGGIAVRFCNTALVVHPAPTV